jgi:LysM repeat protein
MFAVMSFQVRITVCALFLPLLTQCGPGSAPATNVVTGPFDHRGNYIEDWVNSPEKWYRPSAPSQKTKPTPVLAKRENERPAQVAVVEPRPAATAAAPKPKPKPVVVKPKPKPMARYAVKKGDNLSRIASRHSVSLSALRRANGISGDLIRPGQMLTIPR